MQLELGSFKENVAFNEPLIKLFYYAHEIIVGKEKENAFQRLNEELQHSNQKIAKEMVNVLFTILQNNLKLLKNVTMQLYQQLFNLYYIMINQEYIKDNGKISMHFYKNVVNIGLELDEFDYVEQFIEEYNNKLITSEPAKHVYFYNKIKFFIYTNEVEEASQLVENLNFKNTLYKFGLKCLKIMLFYDLKEYSLLESAINAFNVALFYNRSYISETNTKLYKNFIYCLKKLYRYSTDPNATKNDVQQLIDFIRSTTQIANRKWVLKKAEILLAGMK